MRLRSDFVSRVGITQMATPQVSFVVTSLRVGLLVLFQAPAARAENPFPLVQTLRPAASHGEFFGGALAEEGPRLAVGASGADDLGVNSGAVYVYEFGPRGWQLDSRLTASDGSANDRFGSSVVLSGGTLVVAARRQLIDRGRRGAVYVFERQGGEWVETRKLVSDTPTGRERPYGTAVLLSGNRMAVESREGTDLHVRGPGEWPLEESFPGVGAVWLIRRTLLLRDRVEDSPALLRFRRRRGAWILSDTLVAPSDQCSWGSATGQFGRRLAVADPTDTSCPERAPGQVHLYRRSRNGWREQQVLRPRIQSSHGVDIGSFGSQLALGNRVLLVRAFDQTFPFFTGTVYVFERRGGRWVEADKLETALGRVEYGRELAVGNDFFFVSNPGRRPGLVEVYGIP